MKILSATLVISILFLSNPVFSAKSSKFCRKVIKKYHTNLKKLTRQAAAVTRACAAKKIKHKKCNKAVAKLEKIEGKISAEDVDSGCSID